MFIIGHRGASGYKPENTLSSFREAMKQKADMIELDVHLCKSGELVVIHDERVERTTNGKGLVAEKTLSEIKSLTIGKNEKIPTLAEVLEIINGKIELNIELKGKNTAFAVNDLIEKYVSTKNWNYQNFWISSFDHYELKTFFELNKQCSLGALICGIPIGYAKFAEKLQARSVNIALDFINREFIEDAQKRGLKVFVYTVNNPADFTRMKELGVDGIFTNYPARMRDIS